MSMERIEKINELLEKYYDSEDSFEQTELAIKLIHGNLDWLINQAEKVENLQEFLRVVYNLSITEINAGYEIRRYFESRILGLEKLIE